MRRSLARGTETHADRFGRPRCFCRTQIQRSAHGHLPSQRKIFHEAADIGNGRGTRQESAAQQYYKAFMSRRRYSRTTQPPVSIHSNTPDKPIQPPLREKCALASPV